MIESVFSGYLGALMPIPIKAEAFRDIYSFFTFLLLLISNCFHINYIIAVR